LRLYSYIVARDYGFAPNPFYGWCTLATCKPEIRRTAQVGDWIVGTGSKQRQRDGHLVYAMHVGEVLTLDQYWTEPRFVRKRPNLAGSTKQAFGDNIYHRTSSNEPWQQENSHHSFHDGSPNPSNVTSDTRTDRVLASTEFVYWGGTGPRIPKKFRLWHGHDICARTQGHKVNFPDALVDSFVQWLTASTVQGYAGGPMDW
jgi:hypothetical protein